MSILNLSTLKVPIASLFSWETSKRRIAPDRRRRYGSMKLEMNTDAGNSDTAVAIVALSAERNGRFFDDCEIS
jgi:hypothetical protein